MDYLQMSIGGEVKNFVRVIDKQIGRIAPVTRRNTFIPNRPGALPQGKDVGVRPIKVIFDIEAADHDDWLNKFDEAMAWINRKEAAELIFGSEPGRMYMASFEGEAPTREIGQYGQVEVNFICEDPFVYKETRITPFLNGFASVVNTGSESAPPIVEAIVKNPITFLDVWNENAYMRIGKPDEIGKVKYDPETVLMNDAMATLNLWSASGTAVDGGTIAGNIASNGYSFRAASFGTGTAWHGPAIKKSIPGAPVTDFSVELSILFTNKTTSTRGRIEYYLLDEQGATVAKIAMKKVGGGSNGNTIEVRLGGMDGVFIMATAGMKGIEWIDFQGIIRLTRKGTKYEVYVAKVHPTTKKHTARAWASHDDKAKKFTRNLAQIQLHIGQSGTTATPDMAALGMKVIRYNPPAEGIPIIARAGDVILMDFKAGQTFLNGEPIQNTSKIKRELGSQYFQLPPGASTVLIEPFEDLTAANLILRSRS